jgi:hypothetical protein
LHERVVPASAEAGETARLATISAQVSAKKLIDRMVLPLLAGDAVLVAVELLSPGRRFSPPPLKE